jgi:AcrR family transcriptional regulator
MATSGPRRGSAAGPGDRSTRTRAALVTGAIEALREVGFAGASAREIARRAGCAQALVFYHFGSVADLLLAALDEVSQSRLARYSPLVGGASSLTGLIDSARTIFGEDLDAGHVTVLVEMIAGARAVPGLGEQVAHRLEPWREFATTAVHSVTGRSPMAALLPADEIAHALVAGLLGLELLANLDGDRDAALAMFDRARAVAALLDATASPGRAPVTDPVRAPR